jgi:hypothetical protein
MNILKSYAEGLKKSFDLVKIVNIIFGATFLPCLIFAAAFNSTIANSFSDRPELNKLFSGFDYTVYNDFMNNYGDFVRPLLNQMLYSGLIYFLFTVFFAGGIIKVFEGSSLISKPQTFFAGAARYFFRFLRLGVYILLIQFFLFVIITAGFMVFLERAVPTSTESKIFTVLVTWFFFQMLFSFFIWIISDYAKIIIVKENSKRVLKPLWYSIIFTVKKIHVTYPLYVILMLTTIVLYILYFTAESYIGSETTFSIILIFLFQQIFIWLRLFAKVWTLGSQFDLFTGYFAGKNRPFLTREMLGDESI